MTRQLYPILVDLEGRLCVVAGGGDVAERKTRGLLACGARVRVVAPEATAGLRELAQTRAIEWTPRAFRPEDAAGARLVFAATNRPEANEAVCASCREAGILYNRAEAPDDSDFIVPVTLRRGAFTLSIATGGASPHLGQVIRGQLEAQFGPEYEAYISVLDQARDEAMEIIRDPQTRRRALRALAEDVEILNEIRRADREKALEHARRIIQDHNPDANPPDHAAP